MFVLSWISIPKKTISSGSLNSPFDGENKTIPIARSVEKINFPFVSMISCTSWFFTSIIFHPLLLCTCMCASAVVHLARLQVPRGKTAKTKIYLWYLSCQQHLDKVLMAAPRWRLPHPCHDVGLPVGSTCFCTFYFTGWNLLRFRIYWNHFRTNPFRPKVDQFGTQNSSGMQSSTSGGFSGATRTPSSVSSTVNLGGLPAKSQILRRERSWKSWKNEMNSGSLT